MKIKTGIRKKEAEDCLLTTPSNLNEMIELTENIEYSYDRKNKYINDFMQF